MKGGGCRHLSPGSDGVESRVTADAIMSLIYIWNGIIAEETAGEPEDGGDDDGETAPLGFPLNRCSWEKLPTMHRALWAGEETKLLVAAFLWSAFRESFNVGKKKGKFGT